VQKLNAGGPIGGISLRTDIPDLAPVVEESNGTGSHQANGKKKPQPQGEKKKAAPAPSPSTTTTATSESTAEKVRILSRARACVRMSCVCVCVCRVRLAHSCYFADDRRNLPRQRRQRSGRRTSRRLSRLP